MKALHCDLEVLVNLVKAVGVGRQLLPDVLRADKDALQVGPGPLHLEPDADHLRGRGCCFETLCVSHIPNKLLGFQHERIEINLLNLFHFNKNITSFILFCGVRERA